MASADSIDNALEKLGTKMDELHSSMSRISMQIIVIRNLSTLEQYLEDVRSNAVRLLSAGEDQTGYEQIEFCISGMKQWLRMQDILDLDMNELVNLHIILTSALKHYSDEYDGILRTNSLSILGKTLNHEYTALLRQLERFWRERTKS